MKAFTEAPEFLPMLNEIHDLRACQGILGWDLETHMPKDGSTPRGYIMATLARLSHLKMTDPKMGDMIQTLESEKVYATLDKTQQALVSKVSKNYKKTAKLPVELVQEFSQATTEAHHVWKKAREEKNFSQFAPLLEKIVMLNQKMAGIWGYDGSPYDALLDEYEPDLTVSQLDPLFENLKATLVPLIKNIADSSTQPDTGFLNQKFITGKQVAFSRYILEEMQFDFTRGRLDMSVHPFTSGADPRDIRLTTRVFEDDVFSCLSSSMHEGGHGLYEQGIDTDLARTPLCGGTSLGIHESQSRLWENLIGRSLPFWTHYYSKLQERFPEQLADVTLDTFYAAVNQVKPSFIRVEADEVTYNMHIVIRYEIEKDIIEGKLAVNDIPDAWNNKYQEYLGITPSHDAEGCLQDVHWSHGSFGYFPTYTLGNLYASQFYNEAKKQLSGLEEKINTGDLKTLQQWLKKEIHHVGGSETASEIVQRVCREDLNADYFTNYLKEKYTTLYQL